MFVFSRLTWWLIGVLHIGRQKDLVSLYYVNICGTSVSTCQQPPLTLVFLKSKLKQSLCDVTKGFVSGLPIFCPFLSHVSLQL